jgi:hypothetical protein
MTAINIFGVTDLDGDAFTLSIDSIYQDEAVNSSGSGNTAPDGEGIGAATAWVRMERDGGGNGRFYHITFTATDTSGSSCSSTVLVNVPMNRGGNGAAVDDGPLFDSTAMP